MGYFGDCFKYFGIANFAVRWVELVFCVLVLVFGGVLPLEKIGDTSDLSLATYDGIYVTAGATRFTVFAGAFGTATTGFIILTVFCKFMHQEWNTWMILVFDILNWIFMLVAWACLAAALSTTWNALIFCKDMGSILDSYRSSTSRPLDSVVSYIQGLQLSCKYTYVGLSFAICVWYLAAFTAGADDRILFIVSLVMTGKTLLNWSDTTAADEEQPGPSTGQESMVERKDSEVNVAPVTEPGPVHT